MTHLRFKKNILSLGLGVCLFSCFFVSEARAAETVADHASFARGLAHYVIGLMHDWEGATEWAVEEYAKASEFDRASYAVRLRLGSDYARLNKFPEAIRELKIAAELDPKNVEPHYLLALIYSAQEDTFKATEEYEVVLKQLASDDPQNVDIHGYLGQLYYSQKKFDKAIEEFQKVFLLDPKNADVLYALGALYSENKDRDRAIEYFKKSIEIDPEHDGSLNSLGYLYAEDGINLDEAMELINRALKIDPDNGAYLDSLGWVYYQKGMLKEALRELLRAGELFKDPVIYDHLGDVYYKLNENENAEKYWKQSLDLKPDQEGVVKKIEGLKKETKAAK
ncbi:MAG TPA: tetratricopeptide repeat protein [Candidatus Omnitrophota bacterium]|nr:tetratricopeptide repeat protein [Candidatus Omnitrophota bacterium]HPD84316.1 tetratricopeptide repeat protein [Candidatus Omnitrophota bacterium]HRZ03173.1 tetratricopeptide repeat protein [Candidatus Omnitrophota bacterium]